MRSTTSRSRASCWRCAREARAAGAGRGLVRRPAARRGSRDRVRVDRQPRRGRRPCVVRRPARRELRRARFHRAGAGRRRGRAAGVAPGRVGAAAGVCADTQKRRRIPAGMQRAAPRSSSRSRQQRQDVGQDDRAGHPARAGRTYFNRRQLQQRDRLPLAVLAAPEDAQFAVYEMVAGSRRHRLPRFDRATEVALVNNIAPRTSSAWAACSCRRDQGARSTRPAGRRRRRGQCRRFVRAVFHGAPFRPTRVFRFGSRTTPTCAPTISPFRCPAAMPTSRVSPAHPGGNRRRSRCRCRPPHVLMRSPRPRWRRCRRAVRGDRRGAAPCRNRSRAARSRCVAQRRRARRRQLQPNRARSPRRSPRWRRPTRGLAGARRHAELGEGTEDLHAGLGRQAKSAGLARLWTVGELSRHAASRSATAAGISAITRPC